MTDINLLQDRDAGDRREELEKKKRQAQIVVELTNPKKVRATDPTVAPKSGVLAFLRKLFGGAPPPLPQQSNRPPRILHQEPEVPKRKELKRRPQKEQEPIRKSITERFVKEEKEEDLEDVFAVQKTPQEPPLRVPLPPSGVAIPKRRTAETVATQAAAPTPPQAPSPEGVLPPIPPPSEPALGVNLVPEEMLEGGGGRNRLVSLGFVALASVLFIALGYIGIVLYQNRIVDETQSVHGQITTIDAAINKLKTTKDAAMSFHTATNNVLTALNQHLYWTKFLSYLEANTVDTVFYKNITVDRSGHLVVIASAKDYHSVARQLIAYQQAKDFVKEVNITSAQSVDTEDASTVDFSASIVLEDTVLLRMAQGVSPTNE